MAVLPVLFIVPNISIYIESYKSFFLKLLKFVILSSSFFFWVLSPVFFVKLSQARVKENLNNYHLLFFYYYYFIIIIFG
jgi:hypothetical protein